MPRPGNSQSFPAVSGRGVQQITSPQCRDNKPTRKEQGLFLACRAYGLLCRVPDTANLFRLYPGVASSKLFPLNVDTTSRHAKSKVIFLLAGTAKGSERQGRRRRATGLLCRVPKTAPPPTPSLKKGGGFPAVSGRGVQQITSGHQRELSGTVSKSCVLAFLQKTWS